MKTIERLLAVLIIGGGSLVVACGGDDDGDEDTMADAASGSVDGSVTGAGNDAGTTASDAAAGTTDGGGERLPAAMAALVKSHCSGCHNKEYEQADTAYRRLKGVASQGACMGTPRLAATSADSLVVKKVMGTAGCGERMPKGCAEDPSKCLTPAEVMVLTSWIDSGAKPE